MTLAGNQNLKLAVCFLIIMAGAILPLQAVTKVKVWEEDLILPTYIVEEADKNPIFYNGRAYQSAQGTVYPYPFLDRLTDIREEKSYRAVYIENEYLKICILPEIGGRIFEAVDKTNHYDFFYRQHVIKPALIGMLGAWISGGVEWNFPHHHRASGFMEVDSTITENADGSATVWVGEIERRHRMQWVVGLTLYPGKSYLEVKVRLANRTPFAHSFLFWTNASVHANDGYQVIFPPDTELATYHGKNQFSHWPISREVFRGVDYSAGVDISWWKNHSSSMSFFAWESRGCFLAGYDHIRRAGVVHVADPYIVPGKKFWTWGTGERGKMWEKILTDEDGPYLELMVGAYSDNQPDYSWLRPFEERNFTEFWYPIRNMKGIKAANRDAVFYGEILPGGKYLVCINTTSLCNNAVIRLTDGDRVIFEETVSVSPSTPFQKRIALPLDVTESQVGVQFLSADKRIILAYIHSPRVNPELPHPASVPTSPEEIDTAEELYLTGLRLEQFFNPILDPYPYYEKALKISPHDYRVNTALGRYYLQSGMVQRAEEVLNRAINRVQWNYTHPKDGEALYYAACCQRMRGNFQGAFDSFQKAAWDGAWAAAAYYQAAELAASQNRFRDALLCCRQALSASGFNTQILTLQAVLFRRLGALDKAHQTARKVLEHNPLHFWAWNECYLSSRSLGIQNAQRFLTGLQEKMRDNPQSYLELACDYMGGGFWEEAENVLVRKTQGVINDASCHPLIFYYLGFIQEKTGQQDKACEYYTRGAKVSPDYCFPFRLESLEILQNALIRNPRDARAAYYIGNLLYEMQPEKAVEAWEVSVREDPGYSIVHRNLALDYARRQNNLGKAVRAMEQAVECAPEDPRLYCERDILYEAAGVPAEIRLSELGKNHYVVSLRDDALSREIALLVRMGRYGRALEILREHHFHVWEGGGDIHNLFIDAHLLCGLSAFDRGETKAAHKHFSAALEYPDNLEVGRPPHGGRETQIAYFIACAALVLENKGEGFKYLKLSAAYDRGWSELSYYKALALKKLGREEDSQKILAGLLTFAENQLAASPSRDFFEKFGERLSVEKRRAQLEYLIGLIYLARGDKNTAREKFQECLRLNPNHLWAPVYMKKTEDF
ncbi:MAG: DUF5107 domain-containing protein [Candidatus Aminicenantes bacterium]|nr:DUF5107 domain-containing protein [Candidatus Aminicenantes bacterium]